MYSSKRLAPIHHNSSQHFSIQYWYYTDKWMWSRRVSCNDSREAILKAGERKRKGYCIHFYSDLPSSWYMHHLSTRHFLTVYPFWEKNGKHNICRLRSSLYKDSLSASGWYYIHSPPCPHMSICLVFTGRNVPWGNHIKLADHSCVGSPSCPHL